MLQTLLTVSDLSIVLALPKRRIRQLANRGELPSIMFPDNQLRFINDEIVEWIHDRPRVAAGNLDLTDVL